MDQRNIVAAVLAAGLALRNKPTADNLYHPMQVKDLMSLYSMFLDAVREMHPDGAES